MLTHEKKQGIVVATPNLKKRVIDMVFVRKIVSIRDMSMSTGLRIEQIMAIGEEYSKSLQTKQPKKTNNKPILELNRDKTVLSYYFEGYEDETMIVRYYSRRVEEISDEVRIKKMSLNVISDAIEFIKKSKDYQLTDEAHQYVSRFRKVIKLYNKINQENTEICEKICSLLTGNAFISSINILSKKAFDDKISNFESNFKKCLEQTDIEPKIKEQGK